MPELRSVISVDFCKALPQRRFRPLVIFHCGASYKCCLISEDWENTEEIGSIYWNTVVYVYVYVFCRCFCLIIFLVSLFPLSKESLPVIRESFQSQDWFSPLLFPLYEYVIFVCLCYTLDTHKGQNRERLLNTALQVQALSFCDFHVWLPTGALTRALEEVLQKFRRKKILNFKNSCVFNDINSSIVPWTEGVQWYLLNQWINTKLPTVSEKRGCSLWRWGFNGDSHFS